MTKQAFQQAVLKQIGGDKNHGWGGADSLAVLMAIVKDATGKELTGDSLAQAKSMVNPSQYRQILEDQKVLNESVKGTRKVKRDFNQFDVIPAETAKK